MNVMNSPMPAANSDFQGTGNGMDHAGEDPGQCQNNKQHSGQEHRRQSLLPGHAEAERRRPAKRIDQKEVFSHSGGERYRVVCQQPHQESCNGGGEAGGVKYRVEIHAGLRQNGGLDKDDVA